MRFLSLLAERRLTRRRRRSTRCSSPFLELPLRFAPGRRPSDECPGRALDERRIFKPTLRFWSQTLISRLASRQQQVDQSCRHVAPLRIGTRIYSRRVPSTQGPARCRAQKPCFRASRWRTVNSRPVPTKRLCLLQSRPCAQASTKTNADDVRYNDQRRRGQPRACGRAFATVQHQSFMADGAQLSSSVLGWADQES